MNRRYLVFLALAVQLFCAHASDTLLIAAGAGYKRPLTEIATAFEGKTGVHVEQMYGHMAGVVEQARQSGQVSIVFGDLYFLEKVQTLSFADYVPLGDGRLVVAWPKGTELKAAADLVQPRFTRIALADSKAAIFGIAANDYLVRSGLEPQLHNRLQVVATVPQVSAYLVSGDVDAGFLNLTEALAIKERIGGYLEIDRKLYAPIRIVGGVVKGFEQQPAVQSLRLFLQSAEVRGILDRYGL